ncbi:MAG: ferritin-like domain-containing protein [Methyloceanibacter sp.]|nr:ferritin-like domain-containing protein [Methyloceanibacter sp.]
MTPPNQVTSGGLLRLLADTFVLLFKTRHLSWRVNRDVASGVRAIVHQDHRDLDDAVDKIARRIIDLGRDLAPSYSALIRSSSVEQELEIRSEMDMIEQVIADHEKILADIDTLSAALPLGDDAETAGLLEHLADCHSNCRDSLAGLLRAPDQSIQ